MRLPQTENLTCVHLGENARDIVDVEAFEIRHPETGRGLELYLKQQAFLDEHAGLMRTYLVRFRPTGECVAYFSLKAGLISINETTESKNVTFDTMPGVELANFAVNDVFIRKYDAKGIGYLIFSKLIVPFVQEHAKTLGIYMIYLFALLFAGLIRAYENYGFGRLAPQDEALLHRRLKPTYDESCIFMYRLLNPAHGMRRHTD